MIKQTLFSARGVRLFFASLLLGVSLSVVPAYGQPAINPAKQIPKSGVPTEEDKCKKKEPTADVGCIEYTVPLKGTPVYPGLDGLELKLIKMAPSPDLFTPDVLFVRGAALESILNDETYPYNGQRFFTFHDKNGDLLRYCFNENATEGLPMEKDFLSGTRAYLLDHAGNVLPNSKGVKAVFLELRPGDGSAMRYSIEAKKAVWCRSRTGQEADFAVLPEAVKPDVIMERGAIRQVKTAGGLVDIVSLGENGLGLPKGFEMQIYGPEQIMGKQYGRYQFSGAPYQTIRVARANAESADENKVNITDTWGAVERRYYFTYQPSVSDWTMSRGHASREEKQLLRDDADGKTYLRVLYDAEGKAVSRVQFTEKLMPWGDVVRTDIATGGPELNQKTIYNYNENKNAWGYGRLMSQINPDGSWVRYEYDLPGRVLKEVTPWSDAPFGSDENAARVKEYQYSAETNDKRPILEIERITGIEVGRTYYRYAKNGAGEYQEIEERAGAQGAAFGATGNERLTKTFYANTASPANAGRLKTAEYSDGRVTSYAYALNPGDSDNFLVTTETEGTVGSPGGVSEKTLRRIKTQNARGLLTKEETQACVAGGSFAPIETRGHAYSHDGFRTATVRNGQVSYEATYSGGRKMSETNEAGIAKTYTYDELDRLETETRKAIGTQPAQKITYNRVLGALDCGCDAEVETVLSTGGLSLKTFVKKDQLGRITEETDTAGMTTIYAHTNGGKTTTIVQPNTAVEVHESALDGRTKSVTGNGITPEYYFAGVNGDGSRWEKTTLRSPFGARWTKTTRDFLGRTIRTERPGFAGATITETRTYDNAAGRLATVKQTVTGGTAPTSSLSSIIYNLSYAYDPVGMLIKTILTRGDVTNITETGTTYVTASGGVWRESFQKQDGVITSRSRTLVGASQATPATVSESWTMSLPQSNMPNAAWDESTATHQTVTLDRSAATRISVTKLPTSVQPAITTAVAGLTVSSVSPSHGGTTRYRYDALGRQTGQKEPRHTAYSEIEYNDKGQIIKITDAAGNATTYLYYANGEIGAGQLRLTTDALGGTVFMQYDLFGNEIYTWGSATYPVAQGYSIYGERTMLRTFRDTTTNFAGAAFPQVASGDTTIWTYDEATGVLLQKTYADGKGPTYNYYADGQLKTRLWARLNPATGERLATNYAYNPQGQLAGIDYADDTPDVTYTYNARGQVAQITDGTGTRNMTYNLQTGAKISERNTGDNQHELRYGYDDYGRPDGYVLLDSATNQNLTAASYEVDSFGRFAVLRGDTIPASLGQSVAGTGNLHSIAHVYGRVAGSNLLSCVENNLLRTDYVYEVNRDIKTAVKNRNAATGEIYSEYTYSHDALDRRSACTQTGKTFAGDAAATDAFFYNPRGEVTGSINNRESAQNRDYAYDSIGNRLTATEGNNTNFKSEYVSNGQNQYEAIKNLGDQPVARSPSYDADGNMLHDGSGLTCVWDAENRLIEVTVNGKQIKYVYDAGGRRIKSGHYENGVLKETERSVFDRWNIVAEKSTIAGGEERLKIYHRGLDLSGSLQGAGGVGGLRSMRVVTQNGNTAKDGKYFYAYDANGNVSECLHESGAYEHYEYDPFGKLTEGSFAGINRIGFSTKQIEPITGYYYYGYRFYDPNAGRWINRDPVEESGGVNLYGMVWNDAVNWIDIIGMLSGIFERNPNLGCNKINCPKEITILIAGGGDETFNRPAQNGVGNDGSYGWTDRNQVVDDIRELRSKCPNTKIILIGHSWGGSTAVNVARDLEKDVKIHKMITLDPAGWLTGDGEKPENVNDWTNIYPKGNFWSPNDWIANIGGKWGDAPGADSNIIHNGGDHADAYGMINAVNDKSPIWANGQPNTSERVRLKALSGAN